MPTYDIETTWYFEAFDMLRSTRGIDISTGFIPLSEIILHANTFGTIDELKTHCKVIIGLDHAHLRHYNKKK